MRVLLLSTYELGHQPLSLAHPAALLRAAGHEVICADLAVEPLPEETVRQVDFVGISVPMHTAIRLGAPLAERVRALNPRAHRCFYGLYASLNADTLLGRYAESVVGGEYETPLLALVDQLSAAVASKAADAGVTASPGATASEGAANPTPSAISAGHATSAGAPWLTAGADRPGETSFSGTAASVERDAQSAGHEVPGSAVSVVIPRRPSSTSQPVTAPSSGGAVAVPTGVATMRTPNHAPFLGRQVFVVPARDLLPPLTRYARLDDGRGSEQLAGYVEASRGCAHRCRHCPITPVYGGRLRVVPEEVVLADIRQQVAQGAQHITFGDPDFLNGVKHSLRLVERLRAEFPSLTYDATIKVEHLLEHRALLPRLKDTGCLFIVSAVEAVDDTVLAHLAKGHTAADVEQALDLVEAAGLVVRPTFVPFTPWTTLAGYLDLLAFVERRRLFRHVTPVQLAVRLLVPRGSSLIGAPGMAGLLGSFDEATFTYTWQHPDPRVDALQAQVAALVEQAARDTQDEVATFYQIKALARAALGGQAGAPPPLAHVVDLAPVPRLTEAWFC